VLLSDPKDGRNGKGTTALYSPWPESQERGRLSSKGMHTVFSAGASLYQRWQAELLAYSHHKAGQPGPLTWLLSSCEGLHSPFAGDAFLTEPYFPHPLSGDHYTAYNKPKALSAWLEEAPPKEEAVLILDPDCVFLEPLADSVVRGNPLAQPMSYLEPAHERNRAFVKKHCANPELVDGVGIPILIHRDDLREVALLWLKKTEEIRDDPESRMWAGWIAEMWAYAFAAAEVGIEHTVRELARVPTEDRADLPIIHYCYSSSDAEGRWRWDKQTYRPWERVPDPPSEVPLASKALIGLLNEWVEIPENRLCLV
jgi:hypothetical protein